MYVLHNTHTHTVIAQLLPGSTLYCKGKKGYRQVLQFAQNDAHNTRLCACVVPPRLDMQIGYFTIILERELQSVRILKLCHHALQYTQ